MAKPTAEQMEHFYDLQKKGIVNRSNLQVYLENPNRFVEADKGGSSFGLQVTYDQSFGLLDLIERAVGSANLGNINRDITQERFLLKGTGVRSVTCRVEPYLDGETSEQAAQRLTAAGHVLGNTGDLAGFLHDHPEEVEKWEWVHAISENSRWTRPGGFVRVPCAYVNGADRGFDLRDFRDRLDSSYGVLVVCE